MEVAVTTQAIDREKAAICAEAGIPDYWLVDHSRRTVEVYSQPSSPGYESRIIKDANEALEIEGCSLTIAELF